MPKKLAKNLKFIVGIDEAGRGPLAGPVSVGAVVIPFNAKHPLFKIAKDSKQLSEQKREEIFKKIKEAEKEGTLGFAVSLVSTKIIDERGIVPAIKIAVKRCLDKLAVPPHETMIILDGSLKAPDYFLYQKTIIRGDQTEPLISLASIVAKVTRDRKMVQLSKKYPEFDFHIHKGYGTFSHRKKIKKFGPSEVHRRSFLRSLV
jgi:ribonuclease HII